MNDTFVCSFDSSNHCIQILCAKLFPSGVGKGLKKKEKTTLFTTQLSSSQISFHLIWEDKITAKKIDAHDWILSAQTDRHRCLIYGEINSLHVQNSFNDVIIKMIWNQKFPSVICLRSKKREWELFRKLRRKYRKYVCITLQTFYKVQWERER